MKKFSLVKVASSPRSRTALREGLRESVDDESEKSLEYDEVRVGT